MVTVLYDTKNLKVSQIVYTFVVYTILNMKTLKQLFIVSGLTILALMLVQGLGLNLAFAQEAIRADDRPGIVGSLSGESGDLRQVIKTIVNFFLMFLGLLAVIMVIYGGFLYISSGGNDESVIEVIDCVQVDGPEDCISKLLQMTLDL